MEQLRQRIAECGKIIEDDELIMHILYHLPSEYSNLNDKYLKDLDDEKAIDLEDLHADLQRKYNRLIDLGHIENSDYDNDEKVTKEEKALKTSSRNSSRENVASVEKLVTKVRIVGF